MAFVEQVMEMARERLVTISHDAGLLDIARLLHAGTDMVVVCNKAKLVGIVTKTDLIERLAETGTLHHSTVALAIMKHQVTTCRPVDDLGDVWAIMRARGFKNLPVMDENDQAIGVLNARDALQVLLQETTDQESLLSDYVTGIGYR